MNCDHFKNLIVKQLAFSADAADAESLRSHLETCEACRQYRTDSAAMWSELDCLVETKPPASRMGEIMTQIATAPTVKTRRGSKQPVAKESWRSTALAAAVLLTLTAGLFAMVLRNGSGNGGKENVPACDGNEKDKEKDNSDSPKPGDSRFGLAPADIEQISACIKDLDDDEFRLRDAATKKLIAMATDATKGAKIKLFIATRLEKNESKDNENLRHGLKMVIAGIEKWELEQAIADSTKGLEQAIDEAPAHFIAPDPAVSEKMKKRVTFAFTEESTADCIEFLHRESGVPIVVDTKTEESGALKTPITLRVSDMEASLALRWVLKLADLDCMIRGKALIVASSERCGRLALEARQHTLPTVDGEAPWTEEESKLLAELIAAEPRFSADDSASGSLRLARVKVLNPGIIEVHARSASHALLDTMIASIKSPGRAEPLPDWVEAIEQGLGRKVSVNWNQSAFGDVVNDIRTLAKANIIIDPKCVAIGRDQKKISFKFEAPLSESLASACSQAELSIEYLNQALFISEKGTGLRTNLCILDVRPALATKVEPRELEKKLNLLQEPLIKAGNKQATAVIIHGRWFAVIDPWTAQRAQALIDSVAKTGKIGELPPEPWFFKHFDREPPKKAGGIEFPPFPHNEAGAKFGTSSPSPHVSKRRKMSHFH